MWFLIAVWRINIIILDHIILSGNLKIEFVRVQYVGGQ